MGCSDSHCPGVGGAGGRGGWDLEVRRDRDRGREGGWPRAGRTAGPLSGPSRACAGPVGHVSMAGADSLSRGREDARCVTRA